MAVETAVRGAAVAASAGGVVTGDGEGGGEAARVGEGKGVAAALEGVRGAFEEAETFVDKVGACCVFRGDGKIAPGNWR